MDITNELRSYFYVTSVLGAQERDAFCRSCKSFLDALSRIDERMCLFEQQHAREIGAHRLSLFFAVAKSTLSGIRTSTHPVSQKKAGACSLPPGACFVKHSHAILDKIEEPTRLALVQPLERAR